MASNKPSRIRCLFNREPQKPRDYPLLGIFILAVCLGISATQTEAETLKWRSGFHLIKAESIQVGDKPGHAIGAGESRGVAFFEDGKVAIAVDRFTFDYTNGSGPSEAYGLFTFEDESSFVVKFQVAATADQKLNTTLFKGKFSFVQGSGRFGGIQGSGNVTGKRFTPLGVGAEIYFDFTGNYTVRSR